MVTWMYDAVAPPPLSPRLSPSMLSGAVLACNDADPEIFFAQEPHGIAQAKAICASCPSRTACLTGALERLEPWGVWGGELFLAGVVIARKRGRGRPRKDEVA